MKCLTAEPSDIPTMSLPVRGAWIEIPPFGISPCSTSSLPVRGAWIEMLLLAWKKSSTQSLPVRGAWIEISRSPLVCPSKRRSPCGERGLK